MPQPTDSPTAAPALKRVPLLAADTVLGEGLGAAERALAHEVTVGAVSLPAGPWLPPAEPPEDAIGLLVVRGLALRQVELSGRRQAQILGPGDIADPWSPVTRDLTPRPAPWRLLEPVVLAVIDDAAVAAAQRFPALGIALVRRLVERAEQLSALATLGQLPRVDLRLLAVMWHLAHRWGRMGSDGVLLRLPLTHEALGHLVGARRPSVTLALQQLDAAGLLRRRPGGGDWVLARQTEDILQADGSALDAWYASQDVR